MFWLRRRRGWASVLRRRAAEEGLKRELFSAKKERELSDRNLAQARGRIADLTEAAEAAATREAALRATAAEAASAAADAVTRAEEASAASAAARAAAAASNAARAQAEAAAAEAASEVAALKAARAGAQDDGGARAHARLAAGGFRTRACACARAHGVPGR
jgi:hypothetical protein